MPIDYDSGREMVRLATIDAIEAIPDADSIEAATVGGWTVVIKKDEFVVGDPVVYFEIDTCLPLDDDRFAFLAPRGSKEVDERLFHVLKTARLRGVYSQGLALPAGQFPDLGELKFGKWEQPIPTGAGSIIGQFPSLYARQTDSERAQNLTRQWAEIARHPGGWLASEKVDGSSCTALKDAAGILHVAGRNWEIGDGDNMYWRAIRETLGSDFGDLLAPGEGLQCEVVGPGVQENRLGLPRLRILIFNIIKDRVAVPRAQWPAWASKNAVPTYDLPFPSGPAEAIAQVDGLKSLVSPGRLAEGVVWHTADGSVAPALGRETWKAINNKYLLKG